MKPNLFLIFSLGLPIIAGEIRFGELQTAALENSHRLKVRSIDTRIEEARLGSLTSSLYPQISMGYNGEYSKNLDSAASGNIMVGDMTISPNTLYKNSLALRLNYELYRFGTTLKQIEMSEKEISIKKLEQCSEEVKLVSELLDHYARAQKADAENRHKSQMHTLRRELYGLKQRLYTAGKESRVSVGDEAIRLIDLERDIEKSKMTYEENLLALSKLSHTELDLQTTRLLPLEPLAAAAGNLDFDTVAQARQYQEKILQKNAEIMMLDRSQLPIVSLYTNYYLYGSDSHNANDALNATRPNSWNAGLSIRWSLFEGFKYYSESSRLHYELQRIHEEYALAKREFDYETQTKQQHLERLSMLTKNETEALNETRSKLTMTQRLREQGEADALSEVSVKLERVEREMTLEIETLQHAYEAESLKLQHRGVDACREK